MKRIAFILVLLLLVCGIAAADDGIHPLDSDVSEKLGDAQTTAEMMEVYAYALEEWDKELNENYKALMQRLSKERQEQLRASQREWIQFRDLEFQFNADFHRDNGGTMAGINIAAFQSDFVRNRALELRGYLPDDL